MKYIIYLFLICMSKGAFAKQSCPIKLNNPNIIISVSNEKINYNYNKTSRELRGISDDIDSEDNYKHLLGVFKNNKIQKINPQISFYGSDNIGYCLVFTKINVDIEGEPTIFISREAQRFACTKHRTEQHELLHYKFDQEALERYVNYLNKDLKRLFKNHFYFRNKQEISSFVESVSKQYLDISKEFSNKYATPLHKKIDTNENYKQESSYCSYQENYLLQKMLERNN